jgi:hypothetical protein
MPMVRQLRYFKSTLTLKVLSHAWKRRFGNNCDRRDRSEQLSVKQDERQGNVPKQPTTADIFTPVAATVRRRNLGPLSKIVVIHLIATPCAANGWAVTTE